VSERIDQIKKAIEHVAGVPAEHIESVPIKEMYGEKVVWEGVVERFVLLGHPQEVSEAYGWRIGTGETATYKTVLQVPPVKSPHDAVRASVVAEIKKIQSR
jgi:hypothetical protein